MTTTTENLTNTASPSAPSYLDILLRQELADRGGWYRTFGIIWLIGLWILPVFNHPLFFLWIGLILVFLVTPVQTGVDVLDGTEEFTFTQPPTRAEVFLSRILPGAVFLFVTGLIGVLAVGFDLPQKIWGLVFSGGLTTPFRPVKEVHWYPLAVLIPVAAHVIAGGFAALAITRQQVLWAGLIGIIGAWAIAGIGLALEQGLTDRLHGWISTPLLFIATAGIFAFCFRAYQAKEATRAGAAAPLASRGSRWPWIVLLIVVAVILFMSFFWVRSAEVKSEVREAQKVERLRIDEAKRIRSTEAGSN
jgi:hypothetical protein